MKKERNYNYDNFYDFEEFTAKIIKKFINRYKDELRLKFKGLNLERSCEKYLYYKINSSDSFYSFFIDIKKNKLKKNYTFECYELQLLALELKKIYKLKNIKIYYKKNYVKKFLFLIIYSAFLLFSFLFTFRENNNKNIISILNHNKFKKEFEFLFNKIKIKIIYAQYARFIPLSALCLLKLNFKVYFKNIINQKKFFFMHGIYLRTYIYDSIISMNNPLFIFFYEGDAVDHEICSEIAKKKNIKSICLQWGSTLYNKPKSSFRNSGYSTLLAWGKNYADIFHKHNPNVNIEIIGTPHLKSYAYKKNKILFLLPQKSHQFISNELEKFYKFIKWTSEKFPGKVIVRTHPQDSLKMTTKNLNYTQKITIEDSKKISLAKSLSRSFFFIIAGSSAIFEAANLGVIPLLYAESKRTIWNPNIQNLKKNYPIKLFEDKEIFKLRKTIITLESNKALRKRISKKVATNFKNEISFFGPPSIRKFNNYIKSII